MNNQAHIESIASKANPKSERITNSLFIKFILPVVGWFTFCLVALKIYIPSFVKDNVVNVNMILLCIVVMHLLAIGLIFLLFRKRIEKPLLAVIDAAEEITKGNLVSEITAHANDETGQMLVAMQKMQKNLKAMVSEIRSSAHSVNTSASEIASGNVDLSRRTEQQASSLEEIAASIEQLTGTVDQNADNARQADQLSSGARDQAEKGGAVVASAITAMREINNSSQKIADIIGVIDEIAFQTNLLALNAAVEAARAGEQGRGFAVVASEVRNLAQRSAGAAKEIKVLINDSVDKVTEGSKLVNESGETLEEIVLSVKKVSDIVAEIAAASAEQATGIEQVNMGVTQMDQTTQQNAALVEEAAAASESMDEQSENLIKLMEYFDVGEKPTKNSLSKESANERRKHDRPWEKSSDIPGQTAQQEVKQSVLEPNLKVVSANGDSEWEEF